MLALAVLYLILFSVDPLRLDNSKLALWDQTIERLTFSRYPAQMQSKLAVVLIDDDTLDDWREDWPLSYRRLRGVIHQLACAQVALVFFDSFPARKNETPPAEQEKLRDAILSPSQDGPPCGEGRRPADTQILFGKTQDDVPAARNARVNGEPGILNWLDQTHRRMWIEYESDDDLTYPAGPKQFTDADWANGETTPAFGIARRICEQEPVPPGVWEEFCRNRRVLAARQPLRLQWSGGVDRDQNKYMDTQHLCMDVTGTGAWLAWAFNLPLTGRQHCPPIFSVTGKQLYAGNDIIAPGKSSDKSSDNLAPLDGRVVFVGTRLAGINDWITTPLHGALPGVYVHAMAFDNLLSRGDAYPTIPPAQYLQFLLFPIFLCVELMREIIAVEFSVHTGRAAAVWSARSNPSIVGQSHLGNALAARRRAAATGLILLAMSGLAYAVAVGPLHWSAIFMSFVVAKFIIYYLISRLNGLLPPVHRGHQVTD